MSLPNMLDVFDKLKLFIGYEFNNNLGLVNFAGFVVILLAIELGHIFSILSKLSEVLFYFFCKLFRIKEQLKPPILGEKNSSKNEYIMLFTLFVVCICFVERVISNKI